MVSFSKQPQNLPHLPPEGTSVCKNVKRGDLLPVLPISTCSSVPSPALFWPKRKSISTRSTPRTKAWEGNVTNEDGLDLPLPSDRFRTSGQQSSSAAHLPPLAGDLPLPHSLPLLLVPQERRAEGAGGLPKGQGWWQQSENRSGCARGHHISHPAGLSGGLVETGSQFSLLFSPGAGGNLTLLSSEVTEYFLSSPFCLCIFKQRALQRPTCACFVRFPAHLAVLDKVPRPDCSKK